MRTLPTGAATDLAICMGNAFGYLDHKGTERFLADLARLVAPGGALVLDYAFVAESLLPGLSLDEEPMTVGGVTAAGFAAVEQYGDVDGAPFRLGSPRLLLVARRV